MSGFQEHPTPQEHRLARLDAFRPYLQQVANRWGGIYSNRRNGPDLIQEVFIRALGILKARPEVSEAELLRILIGIMRNCGRNLLRKMCREDFVRIRLAEGLRRDRAGAESPLFRSLSREFDELLRDALVHLSERYRRVIVWRYLEEMTWRTIGCRLNCSERAVRKMARRALRNLKNTLEGHM